MQNLFTRNSFCWSSLLLSVSGLAAVQAQPTLTAASSTNISFTPPQLPEGGGQAALVRAIQQRVTYPRHALRYMIQGQNQVSFVVAPDGQVHRVKITRGIEPEIDTAVVNAVRQLPRLVPAMQFGRAVACILTAPVTFTIRDVPKPSKNLLPVTDSLRPYTAVQRMPMYQGNLGYSLLVADLTAEYLRLQSNTGCFIPHNNISIGLTIGPGGSIYDVQLITDVTQ